MSERKRVLFLCTGNSCRSQMAEGWLRELAGERFESLSAGTHPQGIHPVAVQTMQGFGIDISGQSSDLIDEYTVEGRIPDLVISVCDNAKESCPIFPGKTERLHWPFPDPAHATGTESQIAAEFQSVSESVRDRLSAWIAAGCEPLA